MKSKYYGLKNQAINLRRSGKTYGEILKILNKKIPKSTLSDWFSAITLTSSEKKKIQKAVKESSRKGMEIARMINKQKREEYLKSIITRNQHLSLSLENIEIAKIVLAVLYLAEGAKSLKRGSLYFGNSDPFIIDMFLSLMRKCYNIDESKFRCTILCRADQDIIKLENFWTKLTKIPKSQFYKSRIDPRTIGKPSKNLSYKGVCRIDYFSADLFLDLMQIPKIIYHGPVAQW